jgi:uncharacterized protein (TIGR02678 family)
MTGVVEPSFVEDGSPSRAPFAAVTGAEAQAVDALLGLHEVEAQPDDAEPHARAFMTLLERPFIQERGEPELFADLQRRYETVRDWYASRAQWRVERQIGTMRLRRVVDQPFVSHGIKDLTTAADYEVLCLVLYYAEGLAGERFTLSGLTAAVTRETKRSDGTARMPWIERQHRLVLKRVLDVLGRLGAIVILEGNMDAYVAEPTSADGSTGVEALLERGPQFRLFAATVPEWLTEERIASGDPTWFERPPRSERLLPHHRLYRALLTGPAIYRDLDPEAFALLQHDDTRQFVSQDLVNQFGCTLELMRDYAALVRPKSERNRGQTFPERNDLAMLLLLAANDIRGAVSDGSTAIEAGASGRVTVSRVWFADCLWRTRENPAFSLGSRIRDLSRNALAEEAIEYLQRAGVAIYDGTRQLLTLLPVFARVVGQYKANEEGSLSNASEDGASATVAQMSLIAEIPQ